MKLLISSKQTTNHKSHLTNNTTHNHNHNHHFRHHNQQNHSHHTNDFIKNLNDKSVYSSHLILASTPSITLPSTGRSFIPKFSAKDLYLVENFLLNLKLVNGNWSQNGLQRMARLKSACSHHYVSLRSSPRHVAADVTYEHHLKDPFSESMIYLILLKLRLP